MSWVDRFFAISVDYLNLFSFMLGMLYTLMLVTLRNQRFLWLQLLIYVTIIAILRGDR